MTQTKRSGALQGDRAGENVLDRTPPDYINSLPSQSEMTAYQIDRWLTVIPNWEGHQNG